MIKAKTLYAIRLIAAGMTWRAACEKAGVTQAAVSRAIKAPICPTCGNTIVPPK